LTRTLCGLDEKSRRKKEVRTKRISLQNATMYEVQYTIGISNESPVAIIIKITHHHPSSSIKLPL
jgi:hypothetical protein